MTDAALLEVRHLRTTYRRDAESVRAVDDVSFDVRTGEIVALVGESGSGKSAVASTVNINSASAAEFETLPGVGAKTAALIVEYRQKNGPFKKVEEILESSRSCPYLLSISRLSAHQSVAGNR